MNNQMYVDELLMRFAPRVLLIALVACYFLFGKDIQYYRELGGGLVLLMSAYLVFVSRVNVGLFSVFLFVAYCNYSVVLGEYFFDGRLGAPLYDVKFTHIYDSLLYLLLAFSSVLTIIYNPSASIDVEDVVVDSPYVFFGAIFVLVLVFIFGVDRGASSGYMVRISSFYEYSVAIFLLAFIVSGLSPARNGFLLIFMGVFALQDLFYGGRITSVQLALLSVITIFARTVKLKHVCLAFVLGVFLLAFVGASRFGLEGGSLSGAILNIFSNYFVFDTSVYAFYASATHVAASALAGQEAKTQSFISFLLLILLGSVSEGETLTSYVSDNFFPNLGGGFFPSSFFFWFGWVGVVFASAALGLLINKLSRTTTQLGFCLMAILVATAPRWYLYSPGNLLRGMLVFSVIFLLAMACRQVISTSEVDHEDIDS